jgi:pyrroline-5-carboxylate reductase
MTEEETGKQTREESYAHFINRSITVLGAGNMGTALIKGIIKAQLTPLDKILLCGRRHEKLNALSQELKVRYTMNNREAVASSEIVILGVKPQTLASVLEETKEEFSDGQLVLSIAAGVNIESIRKKIGKKIAVVRAMPNIAVTVDEGATAISFGSYVSEEQQRIAISIFEAVGEVVVVPEAQLDAVTGLSGSGPAYIYMVIEALIDGGVKNGIPRDIATKLAIQTVRGSATLVKTSGLHPAILRDQVTTPGGTAINAIHELETRGLRSMLINAVGVAANRSSELSKLVNNND